MSSKASRAASTLERAAKILERRLSASSRVRIPCPMMVSLGPSIGSALCRVSARALEDDSLRSRDETNVPDGAQLRDRFGGDDRASENGSEAAPGWGFDDRGDVEKMA